jgi:hypothetical protein
MKQQALNARVGAVVQFNPYQYRTGTLENINAWTELVNQLIGARYLEDPSEKHALQSQISLLLS